MKSSVPQIRPSLRTARVRIQRIQSAQRLVGHVPLAEDFVDHAGREAGGDEAAHDAGSFFFVLGLANALAFEVLAGEGFFVGLAVAGFEGLVDESRANALLLQVLADAALAQLFVLLAQAGVGFGKGLVVEIAAAL